MIKRESLAIEKNKKSKRCLQLAGTFSYIIQLALLAPVPSTSPWISDSTANFIISSFGDSNHKWGACISSVSMHPLSGLNIIDTYYETVIKENSMLN